MDNTTNGVGLFARTLQLAETCPRRIKQRHMAEAIGVSTSYLSDLLNERRKNPSVHVVQKLHDYLVSVSE